jgi:hypothetical protein
MRDTSVPTPFSVWLIRINCLSVYVEQEILVSTPLIETISSSVVTGNSSTVMILKEDRKSKIFFFFKSLSCVFIMGVKKRNIEEVEELPSRPDAYESLLKRMRGTKKRKIPVPAPISVDTDGSASEGEDLNEENSDNEATHVGVTEESEKVESEESEKNLAGLQIYITPDDPFETYFGEQVSTKLDFPVAAAKNGEWQTSTESCQILGQVSQSTLKEVDSPFSDIIPPTSGSSLKDYNVLDHLDEKWRVVNKKALKSAKAGDDAVVFTHQQARLMDFMHGYRDILYQSENEKSIKQIRDVYTLHALNHVMK